MHNLFLMCIAKAISTTLEILIKYGSTWGPTHGCEDEMQKTVKTIVPL